MIKPKLVPSKEVEHNKEITNLLTTILNQKERNDSLLLETPSFKRQLTHRFQKRPTKVIYNQFFKDRGFLPPKQAPTKCDI
jgi:hypothetical protein